MMKTKSALLALFVFPFGIALAAPAPLKMTVSPAPKEGIVQNETQIERMVFQKKSFFRVVQMPEALGAAYTISLWVKLDESPNLHTDKQDKDAPPTIVDIHSNDVDQRVVIRVRNSKFDVLQLRGKTSNLVSLPGINSKAEAGKWYHLVYSHSKASDVFYVNGTAVKRVQNNSNPQDKLQNIVFGRLRSAQRRLEGIIIQPRIYSEALNENAVRELYEARPGGVK